MSRHSHHRGGVPLLVVVGGGAALAVLLFRSHLGASLRGLCSGTPGDVPPQEPAYVELPDRPAERDPVDGGIADGIAVAQAVRGNGAASGANAGAGEF